MVLKRTRTLLKNNPVLWTVFLGILTSVIGFSLIGLSVLLRTNVLAILTIPAIPFFAGWFGWKEGRDGLNWNRTLAFACVIGVSFACFTFLVSHGRPNPSGYVIALLLFISCAVSARAMARWRQGKRFITAAMFLGTFTVVVCGWKFLPKLYHKRENQKTLAMVDKPLPELALTDLSGTHIPETAWRGKVTVIDFWGVWCVNCIAEMPQMNAVYAKYKNNPGVQFVGVNSELNGDDISKIKRFLARGVTNLPQALDPSHTCDTLGVSTLPQTLVVDHHAHVRFLHNEFDREGGETALSNEIDYLIKSASD